MFSLDLPRGAQYHQQSEGLISAFTGAEEEGKPKVWHGQTRHEGCLWRGLKSPLSWTAHSSLWQKLLLVIGLVEENMRASWSASGQSLVNWAQSPTPSSHQFKPKPDFAFKPYVCASTSSAGETTGNFRGETLPSAPEAVSLLIVWPQPPKPSHAFGNLTTAAVVWKKGKAYASSKPEQTRYIWVLFSPRQPFQMRSPASGTYFPAFT